MLCDPSNLLRKERGYRTLYGDGVGTAADPARRAHRRPHKAERTTIGAILRKLTTEDGVAALLVEHDLDFVRQISSRIVVLHQGRLVLDGTVEEVVNSETVRTIYAGGGH